MIRPHLAAALSQHYPNHAFCVVDDEVTWQGDPPTVDEAAIAATETALASAALQKLLETAVQRHLDATARADGWDSIYTASLRSAFPGPWQAKGIAYATWMDDCWRKCHEVQGAVAAGTRPVPTEAELIAELPVMESA